MDKEQRQATITKMVDKKGTVRISEMVDLLGVTPMTVRRDMTELEELGVLTRIHGGARSTHSYKYKESSHLEKHSQNIAEKLYIAQKAVTLVEEGDTIFLGPGTTVELFAGTLNHRRLRVVTNCLPVFHALSDKASDLFQVFLLGGEKRKLTETFVGEITYTILEKLKFTKAFIGANAIKDNDVMTSNYEEGYTQNLALRHSVEKYLLIDSSKLDKGDFVTFFKLSDFTAVITNEKDKEKLSQLSMWTECIN